MTTNERVTGDYGGSVGVARVIARDRRRLFRAARRKWTRFQSGRGFRRARVSLRDSLSRSRHDGSDILELVLLEFLLCVSRLPSFDFPALVGGREHLVKGAQDPAFACFFFSSSVRFFAAAAPPGAQQSWLSLSRLSRRRLRARRILSKPRSHTSTRPMDSRSRVPTSGPRGGRPPLVR